MARRKSGPIRTVLALGNPSGAQLPETESEVNGLRELYGPANAQVLTGDAEPGTIIGFEATVDSLTRNPFLLTVSGSPEKIEGWPETAARSRR